MPEITDYLSDLQIERIKPSPDRVSQHWVTVPHSYLGCDRAGITSRLSHRLWLRLVPMAMSVFAITEWWVGDQHHSLSLLADAGHLWFDALAIWFYERADEIATLANRLGLLVIIMLDQAITGLSLQQPVVFIVSIPLIALETNCGANIFVSKNQP